MDSKLKAVLAIAALVLIVYLFGIEVGTFYERERILRHDFNRLLGALDDLRHKEVPSGIASQEARCADGHENPPVEDQEGGKEQIEKPSQGSAVRR
jgi:hypothetical protein